MRHRIKKAFHFLPHPPSPLPLPSCHLLLSFRLCKSLHERKEVSARVTEFISQRSPMPIQLDSRDGACTVSTKKLAEGITSNDVTTRLLQLLYSTKWVEHDAQNLSVVPNLYDV